MQKVRTIRLYGKLGAQFGRIHRYAVSSTGDGIRALCSMVSGFERELMTSADRGIAYACFIGKTNIGPESLANPVGADDIRIAPVLQGSKSGGLFQVILGAALVGLALWNPLGLMVGQFAVFDGIMGIGVAMGLGGAIQMLSPQPKGLGARDSVNNGASYNFNGAVNVQAQGNPEPLFYGETIVGSVAISGGIYAEDQQ